MLLKSNYIQTALAVPNRIYSYMLTSPQDIFQWNLPPISNKNTCSMRWCDECLSTFTYRRQLNLLLLSNSRDNIFPTPNVWFFNFAGRSCWSRGFHHIRGHLSHDDAHVTDSLFPQRYNGQPLSKNPRNQNNAMILLVAAHPCSRRKTRNGIPNTQRRRLRFVVKQKYAELSPGHITNMLYDQIPYDLVWEVALSLMGEAQPRMKIRKKHSKVEEGWEKGICLGKKVRKSRKGWVKFRGLEQWQTTPRWQSRKRELKSEEWRVSQRMYWMMMIMRENEAI